MPSVSSESRCDSFSPTQRIGSRPARSAAGTLRARASSDSPKYWRRSEWPRMTPSTPTSSSIGAETSPVNALSPSSCMFWAATRTGESEQRSTVSASEVNGGQTTTSGPPSGTFGRNSARKATESPTVLCIFQLAARIAVLGILQRLHSRQLAPLDQLERGPAAGRDPVDRVSEAELMKRCHRIATPDDRVARSGCDRLGHGPRSTGEGLELEGAHGTIPEDRARPRNPLREIGDRVGADIEPHPSLRYVDSVEQPGLRLRIEILAEAQVLRELEDRVAVLRLGEDTLGRVHALLLNQRVAGVPPLRLEEAEAHGSADQDLLREAEELVDHAE